MKKIVYAMLLLSATSYCQSIERQVIASAGTSWANSTAQLDFTIGEAVIGMHTNATATLTQGFQQGVLKLTVKIAPIAMLQGAATTTALMNDGLRVGGIIPTTSPYTDGKTCNASVFTTTGNKAVVDWVWVELRDANNKNTVIAGQSALILRDGTVTSTDGVSPLVFDKAAANYYVAVNHRNHLGVLTASAIALTPSNTTVNFTNNINAIAGGTNGVATVNGRYTLIAGDFNGNGQVQTSDVNSVRALLGGSGYNKADCDMNGQIQTTDINNFINPNIGRGQQF